MDSLVQERCIFALTIALGSRYYLRSSVSMAVDLEDLILVEASRSCGLGRDVLSRLPQQIISRRADVVVAYHTVLEALVYQLGRAELNSGEWWDRVNASARSAGGAAAASASSSSSSVALALAELSLLAGGGGAAPVQPVSLSVEAFFDHYRPRGSETWGSLAERSGGMAKYQRVSEAAAGAVGAAAAAPALALAFPSAEAPASLDDYLRVYCGSGPGGDAVAQRVLLGVHSEGGWDAEALLPSVPALRQATQEAEAVKAQGRYAPPQQLQAAAGTRGRGTGRGGRGGRGAGHGSKGSKGKKVGKAAAAHSAAAAAGAAAVAEGYGGSSAGQFDAYGAAAAAAAAAPAGQAFLPLF